MEHLDILGDASCYCLPHPRTLQELERAFEEFGIPQLLTNSLIDSMSQRCSALLAVRGNHTFYCVFSSNLSKANWNDLMPWKFVPALPMGEMADPTLLNLAYDVQNVLIGGKYYKTQNPSSVLVDSNPISGRKREVDYYKDVDIKLGEPLDIFGSKIFLYDCDEYTRNYYRTTYNKELETVPRKEEEVFHTHKIVPGHEDFGLPEESLRTNDPFKPMENNIDLLKFFKNES
ncbi:EF-hand domain-containing family member C2 [Nephila pilipes]|uniref:EF-hand domain-containing family member C2 n=1 Tax=Nephila pilipes TaxID=299642 RepID=A0A8X6QP03_NEPPI|nr:EF-hand domain-containing family member C2 [Nephila pilipes]